MFGKSLVFFTAALGAANAYKATMTAYGSSDNNGSGNCVKTGACGYYFDVSILPIRTTTCPLRLEHSLAIRPPSLRTYTVLGPAKAPALLAANAMP